MTDYNNHKIKKITNAGVVSTYAGSTLGYTEGTGTDAQFNFPAGVIVDANGIVFVTDKSNHTIRKITEGTVLQGSAVGQAGDHDVTLNADDGLLDTDQIFTITVSDVTAPTITSIVRQDPITESAHHQTVTFRITFNEDVSNVDISDFEIKAGGASGTINSVTIETAGTVFDVEVNGISVAGTLDLDIKSGHDIVDGATNSLTALDPTDLEETYTFQNSAPTFTSSFILDVNDDETYTYNIITNDTDGDVLTLTAPVPLVLPMLPEPANVVTTPPEVTFLILRLKASAT